MKKIVQKDTKEGEVLREKASLVDFKKTSKEKIDQMVKDMKDSMFKEADGVALAAPQIGLSLRMFVINPIAYKEAKYEGEIKTVFINPKITKQSRDKKMMEEGCLSVRPLYGKVRRSSRATVEAHDESGKKFEISAGGLLAQIFQHEIDHLDGILFTDKAKDLFELK